MTRTVVESKTKTAIIGFDQPFCVIGERINPTGRKQLQAALEREDFEIVRRDAVDQVAAGRRLDPIETFFGHNSMGAFSYRDHIRAWSLMDLCMREDRERWLQNLGLERPYLLFVGNPSKPHKNLDNVVKAYAKALEIFQFDADLVCIGDRQGMEFRIRQRAEQMRLAGEQAAF